MVYNFKKWIAEALLMASFDEMYAILVNAQERTGELALVPIIKRADSSRRSGKTRRLMASFDEMRTIMFGGYERSGDLNLLPVIKRADDALTLTKKEQ